MKKGKCKLCLLEKRLCRSHLIPRAVYALCRAQKAPNPNPMMVTHKLALQTSRQAQWPLLCFECEQLLREKGEDWVLPQLAQYGDIFPFGETLKASPYFFIEPDVAAYALDGHPTLRADDRFISQWEFSGKDQSTLGLGRGQNLGSTSETTGYPRRHFPRLPEQEASFDARLRCRPAGRETL
jgi:hypothetical protein